MSSTSPIAAHRSSLTARPSSRRLTVLASASAASAGVGLASVGVWLDQAMLGVAGAAVAAVPSLWLALRPTRSADAASGFPPTQEWLSDATGQVVEAPETPVAAPPADSTEPVTASTVGGARPTTVTASLPGAVPTPVRTGSAKEPVWTLPLAPYRPAILPAPVRPALTAARTASPAQPARVDGQAVARTVSVTETRRVSVADQPGPSAAPMPAPMAMRSPGAAPAAARVASPVDLRDPARVDTAELQLIWDLGEAGEPPTTGPPRTSRGRHVATTPVDHKPDRTPRADSPRRRARHRA